MYNINQIDCTLKYGKVYVKQLTILKIVSLLMIILSSVLIAGGITLFMLSEISNYEFGLMVIVCCWCLLIFAISYYTYNKNKKRNKEITEWLNDAVECKAKINRLDLISKDYQFYQIEVVFNYKGNELKRISNKRSLLTEGYPKVFAKYHNKKMNILYSVKYDEVLLVNHKNKE